MAYKGYRVEAFIPAGRKRTMSILLDNLSRFTHIVDKVQVWMNTDEEQVEDREWLKTLPDCYNGFVELKYLDAESYNIRPKQLRTGLFYAHNTTQPDTIYIRFDDDIVFIDDAFFVELLEFRLTHPTYFLVMANIWNNAVTSWIQQKIQHVPADDYLVEQPYCMDPVGWRNGKFAELLHRILIEKVTENRTSDLLFDHADLHGHARFSISCFCFFGKDFQPFEGIVGQRRYGKVHFDEEIWLTEVYPTLNDKLNTICGSALVAHYSFFAQRPYLDTTDILETYRAIGKGKLSDSYYDLLDNGKNESISHENLETVELPALHQVSTYSAALEAELNGYTIHEFHDRVEIHFNEHVVKTLSGKLYETIFDADIDRALASLWNNHRQSGLGVAKNVPVPRLLQPETPPQPQQPLQV